MKTLRLATLTAAITTLLVLPIVAFALSSCKEHLMAAPLPKPDPSREGLNVTLDFGAVGDGVADDTQAFASAISYFEAHPGWAHIYIPPGTYLVDGIGVVKDVHLLGAGKERTIIRARQAGSGSGIVCRDQRVRVQQLTIENLQLENFQYGIDARNIWHSEFRNLYVLECGTGIYLGGRFALPGGGVTGLTIFDVFLDVRVTSSAVHAMDVDASASGDLVNACQFHSCVFDGSSAARSGSIFLHGLGGNGLTGISFHGCTLQDGAGLDLAQCNGLGWYGGYVEGVSINAGGTVGGLTVSGTYFNLGSAGGSGIQLGTNHGESVNAVIIEGCTFASQGGGIGIEVRSDMGPSSGIFILPNHYLGGNFTSVSDPGARAVQLLSGTGPPASVASPGALYLSTDLQAGTAALWVKETGVANAGWVPK